MEDWVERYILGAVERMGSAPAYTGLKLLTYKQACTLVKVISWACKHDDCPVTEEEGKGLCRAIQYMSNTRPKEEKEK